jgi:acetyl esterase/lipase
MKIVSFRPNPESNAQVIGYLHDPIPDEMPQGVDRPCVVVYPGGAYRFLSQREAEPPAMALYARGYQVFILYYSIRDNASDLRPLIDGSMTLMKIRENSAEWHVIPNKIAVMGFSAGGHAAASLGTLWDAPELKARIDTKGGKNRPDAMILCYAVLTCGEKTEHDTAHCVCGEEMSPEMVELFSLEKHVTPNTPPAFLWHTIEDELVPVENAMMFAEALQKNHVPFECHLFQKGGHGMSMCNAEVGSENPHAAHWFSLAAEWLDDLFQIFH